MKTILSTIKSILRSPIKSILTILTVGIGVCILIIALGLSFAFSRVYAELFADNGLIITFSNAEYADDGTLEPVRPPPIRGKYNGCG